MGDFEKNIQYYKFCLYGFLKNLRFFEPFLILFLLEKEITFLQIGTLYAVREIFINILEIPSGLFADILGRKRSLIFSFIFYIVSFVIFYVSDSYYLFLVAIILYAFGDAFRTGTHKAMIFHYLKLNSWENQKTHYYGNTRSWSQFGSAISSLIAAFIIFYTGNYQSIFIFSTIPYFLDLILISTYPNILNGENIQNFNKEILKQQIITVSRNFIYSFKNTQILRAISNLAVHSGFHRSIKDYLQPVIQSFALSIPLFLYLSDKQRSAILIGIFYFIIFLFTAYASRNAGKLKDRVKSNELALNLTMFIGFGTTFLSGLFFHKGFYVISIIFYVMIYLIENLRNPIGVDYVSSLFKENVLSAALSANSQAKSLFAAIIAPVLGFVADKYGVGVALSTVSVLVIIMTPFFYAKTKSNKDQ